MKANPLIFIDTEVCPRTKKIMDIGAITTDGQKFHSNNIKDFAKFIGQYNFLCGHNIVEHDLKYLSKSITMNHFNFIDTLFLSALLFPARPYHRLVKDDKLQTEELNNPLNDAIKAKDLFFDEVNRFEQLDKKL